MEKLKLLICIFLLSLTLDTYSQVLDSGIDCDLGTEECIAFEYFGDLNKRGKAHGKGKLVWENGVETEGEFVNGNLIKGKPQK